MTTITREEVKAFIEQIESDLSNGWEAQIFELKLARIALASLEAEPIGAFHIADQQVGGTSDYIKDGEWPIDNGVIEVYAAPPATVVPEKLPCSVELKSGLIIGKGCKTETLLTALRRRAEYYAKLEAMTPEEREKHGASIEAFKAMLPQPAPVDKEFIPKNLDKALGVVGVALPESKEEFNFQIERWIQRLIDRVIRYADEFKEQPAPVVPDEMATSDDMNLYQKSFAQGYNACRAAMLQGVEPVSNHDELALYYLQGQKDGLEWAAQLAEENHPHTGDWLYDDPLELAKAIRKGPDMPEFAGSSPVTPDGWISCSERMPDSKTAVLVAREFDRKGDWRMKWATYIPGHPDANDGWIIPGASWIPSHWMPLPEPPQEEK